MPVTNLPLPPSLASALSPHTPKARTPRSNIQALAIHPSLPRLAYLAEETTSLSSSQKKKGERRFSQSIKSQRIIVREFEQNAALNPVEGREAAVLSMEHLTPALNKFRQKNKKGHAPLTLASLGPLQTLTFLDCHSLFWQTRRGSATTSGGMINGDTLLDSMDGLGHGLVLGLQFSRVLAIIRFNNGYTTNDSFDVLCCLEGQQGKENSQYIPTSALIPLTNSTVVYGCSDGAMRFHNLLPSMLYSSRMEGMNSLALSTSLGGSGTSKLAKNVRQSTIKSVRGPNGRNDPIVKMVNVDPAYCNGNNVYKEDATSILRHSRLLTACSSGVAYLWDVHIRLDRNSNSVRDLTVDPPLVRIDGLGSLTVSPRKYPSVGKSKSFWEDATATKAASEPFASKEKEVTKAPYWNVTPAIDYDYHRNLLVWALPSEAPAASIDHRSDFRLESPDMDSPEARRDADDKVYMEKWSGENGGFVKVWNMSVVNELISKSKSAALGSPQPPPKFAPAAILKLHPFSASADSPSCAMGGLMLSPLAPTSLAYTCLSRDGSELMVQAAPLPITAACTDDTWLVQSSIGAVPKKKGRGDKFKTFYANFLTHHQVRLSRHEKIGTMRVRGLSLAASFSSPNSFAVASDKGVIIGNLAEGESWCTEMQSLSLAHESLPPQLFDTSAGPLQTIISGGPVSSLNNRPGVLFIENNSVYASRLTIPRSNNDPKDLVVEKIGFHDPILMHVLHGQNKPWHKLLSSRIAMIAEVRELCNSAPRLIPSPSGRYLTLFWENEMRYEILHARSLLTKDAGNVAGASTPSDRRGPGVSPSVDSGFQVLSFAWIGDDDRFAVLHYVDMNPRKVADAQYSPARGSPARTVYSPPFHDTRIKVLSRLISPSTDGRPDDENSSSSPDQGQIRTHVELKKLAEVEVNAVELAAGASVAAATTVNLGRLTTRGGDRSVPTVLFGGPALCVGCISISNRPNQPCLDNAYFYTHKNGTVKSNDERASAYMTVGPEMPYPSLVAWDEEGKLCAMGFGSRVAIYLSEPPKFTLLSAVSVSTTVDCADSKCSLISLKFIHGVLYCSTQSSVHAIFLGDLKDPETVCETDVFTVATNDVPTFGTDHSYESHPVPVVTSLMQPHVLAYHCGGLLVSTTSGLRLLPLTHPMIRIGALLAAGATEKARKWIFAIPESDHDAMSHFLIRRGRVDLAISDLDGLSIETFINLCMIHSRTEELEYLIEKDGPALISQIHDWKRDNVNGSYSAIFCLGVYFIGKGRMSCAKKWTELCLKSGMNEVITDAMKLSLFISAADRAEGKELLARVSDAMKFDSHGQMPFMSTL